MNLPENIGPIAQLLGADDEHFRNLLPSWNKITVRSIGLGGQAGRWCMEHVKGRWTFVRVITDTHFFIEDRKDAMLFKLTWKL